MGITATKTTSREAHQMVIPIKGSHRKRILEVMEEGVIYTFPQLAMKSGLREEQVWKRLSEMRDKDRTIEEAGILTCPYHGTRMTGWKKVLDAQTEE